MATDHTAGDPPSCGSTILVNIGCTANRSAALRKIAVVKAASRGPNAMAVEDFCWSMVMRPP